jgi:hypothetical protein
MLFLLLDDTLNTGYHWLIDGIYNEKIVNTLSEYSTYCTSALYKMQAFIDGLRFSFLSLK